MQRDALGFDASFRRHLVSEERRALLELFGRDLDPDTTLGEVLDAADSLGHGNSMGEVCLGELAEVLLAREDLRLSPAQDAPRQRAGERAEASTPDGSEDDEDEDEAVEVEAPPTARGRKRGRKPGPVKRGRPPKAKAKVRAKAAKVSARAKPGPKPKTKGKHKASAPVATTSKKAARGRPRTITREELDELDDERMSLDRAIQVFVPIVRKLGKATMQDLEEHTGIGRRKLRFHVGQLVRHDHLERHGMGRGTYYTLA